MVYHKRLKLVRILLLLLFGIIVFVDGKDESKAADVFDWLKNDENFFLSPKLEYNDGNFRAKKTIKPSEVLMVIPTSSVVSVEPTEEEDGGLCELLHALWKEIDLGEASTYAPYVQHLQASQSNRTLTPIFWSSIGRRLLNMVSITSPRSHITTWIDGFEDCLEALSVNTETCDPTDPESCTAKEVEEENDEYDEENDEYYEEGEDGSLITYEVDALEYSQEEKAHRNAFDITIQHHIDLRFLVPLYDQIKHHHFQYNVVHKIQADNSVQVLALKDIAAGEDLQRKSPTCLADCHLKNDTVTSAFRNYGQVQDYPQYWNFPFGVSFIYDPLKEEPLQWIQEPFEFWNLEIMENEYTKQLRVREREIIKSRPSIPEIEWNQIDAYSSAIIRALEVTIADANEIFAGYDSGENEVEEEGENEVEEGEYEVEEEEGDYGEAFGVGGENEEGEYSEGEVETQEWEESMEWEEPMEEYADDESDEFEFYCDNDCFDMGVPTNGPGCEEAECYLGDIGDLRGCPTYGYDAILNQTEWALMRGAYIAIVGPRKSTIKLNYMSGMKVKYRVGFSPGRGRGVFSVEDIPKGTLVWTSEYTAAFETGLQYRKFLRTLPDFMVCDLLIWCYTAKDENSKHLIGCDLDEGSLFNTYDERAEYNIGHLKDFTWDFMGVERVYALRDITAGEELVTAYGSFDTDNFAAFGLQ